MNSSRPAYCEWVRRRLEETPSTRNPGRPEDRGAAVHLGLLGDPPRLVAIVRTDGEDRHGGQFALPGGRQEEGETPWECAQRETQEEIGSELPPLLLGHLGEFNTAVTGYRVQVFVGHYPEAPTLWSPDPVEVAAILEIPIERFLPELESWPRGADPWSLPITFGFDFPLQPHCVAGSVPPKGRGQRFRRRQEEIETPYIWGLTARIMYDFLDRIWIPGIEPNGSASPGS